MADWATVRYDPAWEEKLDDEIVPLCDALNDAGFVTTHSCCGHGSAWAYVGIEHRDEARIERLARFIMARQSTDYFPHLTDFSKDIVDKCVQPCGYLWRMQVRVHSMYADTPASEGLAAMAAALDANTALVREFAAQEPSA